MAYNVQGGVSTAGSIGRVKKSIETGQSYAFGVRSGGEQGSRGGGGLPRHLPRASPRWQPPIKPRLETDESTGDCKAASARCGEAREDFHDENMRRRQARARLLRWDGYVSSGKYAQC